MLNFNEKTGFILPDTYMLGGKPMLLILRLSSRFMF